MNRWIGSALEFLMVLGVLQLARLALLLFCAVELMGMLGLWFWAIAECSIHGIMTYLWIPVGATLLVAIQVGLWQFAWLRLAQRGDRWRALAEFYSRAVRYPVVRTPHPWE